MVYLCKYGTHKYSCIIDSRQKLVVHRLKTIVIMKEEKGFIVGILFLGFYDAVLCG